VDPALVFGNEVCIGIVGILPTNRTALRQRRELHQRQSERDEIWKSATLSPTTTPATASTSTSDVSGESKISAIDEAEDKAWLASLPEKEDDYDYEQLEIGYMLVPSQWKRGYATELCKALLNYSFTRYPHGLSKVATDGIRVIDVPAHAASRKSPPTTTTASTGNGSPPTASSTSNHNGDIDAATAQAESSDIVVWAFTQSGNRSSQSVLAKSGFQIDSYHSHSLAKAYRMTREQWNKLQRDTIATTGNGHVIVKS
jgi:RimJ/RimL family protein N-acetyltransferase